MLGNKVKFQSDVKNRLLRIGFIFIALFILVKVLISTDYFQILMDIAFFTLFVGSFIALFLLQIEDSKKHNSIVDLKKLRKNNREKRKYQAKLKLKNAQRSSMISAIAHEFRNPISAIIGYAQTLNEDEDIPPTLRKKFLQKIHNNSLKIEELLGRLILWNKFENGEHEMQISSFDISKVIEGVMLSLHEKYPNREIIFESKVFFIEADRTLIEIVMKNLIENALKYSQKEVRVVIEDNIISVSDRGVGISQEDISKVTKKFYRSGTLSWNNSMGLGLSIVKWILKRHHTHIDISSTPKVGSTFSFYISPKFKHKKDKNLQEIS